MIRSRKQMFIVTGVFALVMLLGTVTYAFFNYTKTGASNTIRVGRISFVSKNEETITLNNLFPIDPTETGIMNDNTKVGTYSIDIKGDTDYVNGIEYLVSVVDANIYTNVGQVLPISLDITTEGLGTPTTNYFTARENTSASIYKKIVGDTLVGDQMLLVGFIKSNTTSGTAEGVDGSITIKTYLDKNKILVSDTYDGTESDNMGTSDSMAQGKTVLTTTEWNAIQSSGVSFKIKVEANEGIWVNRSLEEIMRKNAVMDNISSEFVTASTGIDFGAISGDTNGKGVYMRTGTENDSYPIVYYRGAVEDNNVIFANKCWRAVRTTDTGGVKLIYNGKTNVSYKGISQSDYMIITNTSNLFNYDPIIEKYVGTDESGTAELEFSVPTGTNYVVELRVKTNSSSGGSPVLSKNGTSVYSPPSNGGGAIFEYTYNAGNLTDTDKINFKFTGSASSSSPIIYEIQVHKSDSEIKLQTCENTGSNVYIDETINDKFNNYNNSPAYVGYMYGDVYTINSGEAINGAYFGSGFTYSNGVYTLTNQLTTKNNTHHYTCNLTTAEGSCATIRYYYYNNYYINLTGGDGVEEAFAKMNSNINNSNVKTQIDTWYASNMNSVTSKLEDTIWCNDRSFGNGNNNGWIANGGELDTFLFYGASERSNYASAFNTSAVKNKPSLVCINKNDAFTVSNGSGNRKLTYPIALLTEDEMVLAGGLAGSLSTFYLNNGSTYYWSLSPYSFSYNYAHEFSVSDGSVYSTDVTNSIGLRPSVSLKPGIPVISGVGTVTNPYVIE